MAFLRPISFGTFRHHQDVDLVSLNVRLPFALIVNRHIFRLQKTLLPFR